jgi:GTP-binding protein LepA
LVTGVISKDGNQQYLDKLKVEKERGITVKAQTCTLFYDHNGERYLINLIDTPVCQPGCSISPQL